jgi:muconolactone delta-isomerase
MCERTAEENVPPADLAARSKELFERLGPEGKKDLFMWLMPGEYANFPEGEVGARCFKE